MNIAAFADLHGSPDRFKKARRLIDEGMNRNW
jgi:Icc-related predicted phosphoesterase